MNKGYNMLFISYAILIYITYQTIEIENLSLKAVGVFSLQSLISQKILTEKRELILEFHRREGA